LPVNPKTASDIVEFSVPVDLGDDRTSIRAYLPRTGQKNPVVFAIYGGAWQWGTPDNDATLNRFLAASGFAVFALDYRHAPAYEFPTPLGDVRTEIALITSQAKKYRVDTGRMAILGHSSGGQMAELIAFAPRTPFRALVSFSGAVDLTMGYEVPPSPDPIDVPGIIRTYMGGTPAQMPDRYHAASPIDNVRCGSPPTLLIYGNRDHVVDFRSALRLRDALRSCGTDVTLLELPWTEHGFEDVPFGLHASIAFAEVDAFLHRTL
jgi:acetyl esterase/lipase